MTTLRHPTVSSSPTNRHSNSIGIRRWALVTSLACGLVAAPGLAYDWLQFNGDAAHSGNNAVEKAVTRNNVATLTQKFQATLPAVADGAPVVLRGVSTASGIRDLLFVTTKAGHIVALDAKTGGQLWSRQYGAGTTCKINNGSNACYTTSSPAIDPNRLYVYSYGLDGYVHKYQVVDGTEITGGGWPQITTLKGFDEKASAALAFATAQGNTCLYVVHGGYPGDNGDYQGHVTAIDLATGAQNVFNTMCSDQAVHFARLPATPNCGSARSAIWARPSVIYNAALDRIYMATGNGTYNGNTGGHHWSESVIALKPDATGASGKPVDVFTPANFQALDNADADLGSTAPALLPVPANSAFAHLALQAGKDAKLRLLDLDDLSGLGGPGNTGGEIGAIINLPQGGGVLTQPAVWVNPSDGATWAFVANNSGISGIKLVIDAQGAPSLVSQWTKTQGGGSPLLVNNLLFYAGSNALRALDPLTGAVLWTSTQIGGTHWESPVAANGMLYISDESAHLTAFAPTAVPTDFDFDFTGRTDLLWRDSGTGATSLSLMNGSLPTSSATLLTLPEWSVINVGDFNGDDKADLLWRNSSTGEIAIWLINGTTFVSGRRIRADPDWSVTHVADFNGDGKADLVWRNGVTGETAVWLMDGANALSMGTMQAPGVWSVTHVGDFNGDGKADLLWRNSVTGQTAIWIMNGLSFATGAILQAPAEWVVTRVGDFNGDGKSDLIWRNSLTGQTAMWLLNGFTFLSGARLQAPPEWSVIHIGDFNGDGKSDLLWRNAVTGQTAVWVMDGIAFWGGAIIRSDANWSVTNVGDFNGDGQNDLIWRNAATGDTAMWLMNGVVMQSSATLNAGAALTVINPR